MTGTRENTIDQPLDGVTVLDFTHALAGPVCTSILGDFGARVIKIERPGVGDISRHMSMKGEQPTDPNQGAASYLGFNKNKESVAIDLAKPQGMAIVRELAAHCDVLIQNFRPGVMSGMGLGYEDLKLIRPDIIYCDISAFGDGPLAQEPGMDLVVQARAGTIAMTGEPGGPPIRPGVSLSDMSGGLNAVIGVLMAIRARDRSGMGQRVNVSLFDSTLLMVSQYIGPVLNSDANPEPMGTGHPQLTPYQAYPTSDGWIFIGCGTNDLFARLCNGMDLPEVSRDERFRTNPARVANRRALELILTEAIRKRSTASWEALLRELGIPVSPIVSPREAFHQALAHGSPMVETIEHPYFGAVHLPGRAAVLSATPGRTRRYPPRLGEDTERVLRDLLRMDQPHFSRLAQDGVVAQFRDEAAAKSV